MEELQRKAADLLSSILIKKLEPKEIDQLVEILKDDSKNISWWNRGLKNYKNHAGS